MRTSTSDIILDEQMFGFHNVSVAFPNLLLCMGFVLRTNAGLWGVHLDQRTTTTTIAPHFWNWCTSKGLISNDITDIFGVCDYQNRYKLGNNAANQREWKVEMGEMATACGFRGPAHGFDTSVALDGQVGAYIEYVNNVGGNRNCKVYFKKQSKMERGNFLFNVPSNQGDDIVQYRNGAIKNTISRAQSWSGKTASGHKGDFHNLNSIKHLNYKVRFTTVQI